MKPGTTLLVDLIS